MDEDKRKGRKPIPDHLKVLLSEEQKAALVQLEGFGWELRFVRMPLFQPLIIALHNAATDKFGILEEDGHLAMGSDLKVRR